VSLNIAVCSISAGRYRIGESAFPDSQPEHLVNLAAFAIARTTVTNAQFAAFIDDGGYQTQNYWTEAGWRWQQHKQAVQPGFWTDSRFNHPTQPVVGIGWYEALAFARWLAQVQDFPWRLPSEAEWEAAARDPEGHIDQSDPAIVNSVEQNTGAAWPVDSDGVESWCGARHMLGNVWEWTSTRWGRNWQRLDYPYPYRQDDSRQNLEGSHARVIRGGSWYDPLSMAHPAQRARYLPGSRASNIGFRLAYTQ
jgi:formylglycine-generating enzyme required for sulfatase activity